MPGSFLQGGLSEAWHSSILHALFLFRRAFPPQYAISVWKAAPLEEDVSVRPGILLVVHQRCSQWLSATWQRLRLGQQLPSVPDAVLRAASDSAAGFYTLRRIRQAHGSYIYHIVKASPQ